MSKKKAFSGNTMTLKDFHGGSIPSDLPLPSAPGVIVRPADRPSYERQTSWGNPMGRSDHRLRPSSSGSIRSLDDKTPFLTTPVNIGRNFDEDERKPLDGALAPRRTVSDESFRTRSTSQHGSVSVTGPGHVSANSYSARVVEGGVNSRPLSGGGGSYPNAWGVRKEVVGQPAENVWNGKNSVTKFAQASALDQISSGRWQTKPVHQQADDVEVVRRSESPNGLYGRENGSYNDGVNSSSEREYYEPSLVRHVVLDEGLRGRVKEMPDVDRVQSPALSDGKEKSSVLYINEGQPAYPDAKHGGSDSQEVSERPKLKLLPRTKPLDPPEPSTVDYKQPMINSHPETRGNIHGNAAYIKPGASSSGANQVKPQVMNEAVSQPVERPKLNLKPRSQPLDHSVEGIQKERVAVFGGARPREMVLKERGVDDVIPNSHEEGRSPIRMKSDSACTETAATHGNTSRHHHHHHQSDKVENLGGHQRAGRGIEKREVRAAPMQKPDAQRKTWRNDNWRNNGKEHTHPEKQQQQQERPASPETWRKPVEQPNPSSETSGSGGLRFGKAVSAAELVQAFSRSVPKPPNNTNTNTNTNTNKPVQQFSGGNAKRSLPGPARSQIPFSRLTGPTNTRPQAQINGY